MECPTISTSSGKVKGRLNQNLDRKPFYSYLGIPYGKPPVGDLRFKAPVPSEPWQGVLDVSKPREPSTQVPSILTNQVIGTEDSLWLNIHTKLGSLKPVIFYIFGGAMTRGQPGDWGPEYLMLEDLVIVFVNFRLGSLGLLALEDTTLGVTGNTNMKDCILALRWVKENIENFGGDPNNITIWGHSSGAFMTHMLVLSPQTKGLINRAFVHSYSAAFIKAEDREKSYNSAAEMVKILGKKAETQKEILEVLQSLPAEDIVFAERKLPSNCMITPIVELPNKEAVITKDPLVLIKNGEYNQIPIIFGYSNKEGLVLTVQTKCEEKSENVKKVIQGLFYDCDAGEFIPEITNFKKDNEKFAKVKRMLEEYYYDEKKWPHIADGLWYLNGDSGLLSPIISAARYHSKSSKENIYLLRSDFDGRNNYLQNLFGLKKNFKGVMHADDLGYIFKHIQVCPDPNFSEVESGSREETAIRRYVKLIANFARTGNPTPDGNLKVQWEPIKDAENLNVLNFGDQLEMMEYPEKDRMNFWRNIFNMSSKTAGFL